jgi:hypothetical protein
VTRRAGVDGEELRAALDQLRAQLGGQQGRPLAPALVARGVHVTVRAIEVAALGDLDDDLDVV